MRTISQGVKLAWHVPDHSLLIALNSRSGVKPPLPLMPSSCAQKQVYLIWVEQFNTTLHYQTSQHPI